MDKNADGHVSSDEYQENIEFALGPYKKWSSQPDEQEG
jgi:hypothetical protein